MSEEVYRRRIEPLNDDNYTIWKHRVTLTLRKRKQWEAVEPGYNGAEEDWTPGQTQTNLEALNFITENIEDKYIPSIVHLTTAAEVWQKLKRRNCEYTWVHIALIIEELALTKKTDEISMN
jgi:hypothetical protein